MKYFHAVFLIFSLLVSDVYGQVEQRCSHLNHAHHSEQNQQLYERFLALKNISSARQESQSFIIPLVVHVIHKGEKIGEGTNISHAQIQSQIDVLNEDFNRQNVDRNNTLPEFQNVARGMDITFVLADLDNAGNPLEEVGVDRIYIPKHEWSMFTLTDSLMPATTWDNTKYYNIWTVGNISGFFGFAQFPDSTNLPGLNVTYNTPISDGMVIDYDHFGSYAKCPSPQLAESAPFHLGRTATHEMGHALGLIHIWGDISTCAGNDYCEDTPNVTSSSSGCDLNRRGCGNLLAMVQNYMDYSDDDCMNLFTTNQVERMKFVLNHSPRRRELTKNASKVLLNLPEEEDTEPEIKIYPNPVRSYVMIDAKNMEVFHYEFTNLLGQTVISQPYSCPRINLPLASGVYVLKIKTSIQDIYKKIVVQR